MKKIKLAVLLCVLVLAVTACGKDNGKSGQNPAEEPSGITDTHEPQEVIDEILTAVKEAYGGNYIPSIEYDAVSMEEYFGIKPELYDVCVAEGPMMSAHIDTFVAVHATEGNARAVEDALNTFRDMQINDAFQYPANMLKIQASRVVTEGDYVFFITLGQIDDSGFTEESQYIEAYEAQNQIAVDAIKSVLYGI